MSNIDTRIISPVADRSLRRDWSRRVEAVHARVLHLRQVVMDYAVRYPGRLKPVRPEHLASAHNLLHYVCLRRQDLRELQEQLAELGLSSLGRSEPHVLSTLTAVSAMLSAAASRRRLRHDTPSEAPDFHSSRHLAERNDRALLGPLPRHRRVRIMVTLPSEAADDETLVRNLLAAGMDCARINCAHDDAAVWSRMLERLREGQAQSGRTCRVLMDLAGPKLRTGSLTLGAQVIKWRPKRDRLGAVLEPVKIWLHPDGVAAKPPEGALPLPVSGNLDVLAGAHEVVFKDARGSRRRLRIGIRQEVGWLASADRTAYVVPDTTLQPVDASGSPIPGEALRVGNLPAEEEPLLLCIDEELILTGPEIPGEAAVLDDQGHVVKPAHIGCTLPEVFSDLRPGERVFFDDGKIGAVITAADAREVRVRITQAKLKGDRLASEKGINLPDSRLHVAALTPKDIEDLRFVAKHADLVGCSFVRSAHDVRDLQRNLLKAGGESRGLLLKIETRQAFDELPQLLLAGMASPVLGVMIARGDLMIECGFERLAEVQEEILWLCEAAHVPVVWATEVLDSLAKTGHPSRAEVTDAAMAARAECVMLNKGPFIDATVRALSNILTRMQEHQRKKHTMLRKLRVAETFAEST
jgi:pyruvate kinase